MLLILRVQVFKAEYHGKPAAVKKFKIDYQAMEDGNPPMDTDLIRKEIVILSKLSHPNVMKFYGASVIMPNICIVTELLPKGAHCFPSLCPLGITFAASLLHIFLCELCADSVAQRFVGCAHSRHSGL